MTNQDLNTRILLLIASGAAVTGQELQKYTESDDARTLDNCLKRLKAKSFIVFDRIEKKWSLTEAGEAEAQALQGQASVSPPSAPIGDGVEQSVNTNQAEAADAGAQETTMKSEHDSNASVGDIDAAINEARSKKGAKSPQEATEAKRPRLSEEEKKVRDEQRAVERAAAKANRDSVRAAKKLEKESARKPAHMSKVSKAAERLPELSPTALELFTDATANLDASTIAALAAHLQHFNRTKATERALNQKVGEGDTVKVVSGDPRFIGKTGTVTKAQRIRCYVNVDETKKPIYLFTSDVEVVTVAAPKAANGG